MAASPTFSFFWTRGVWMPYYLLLLLLLLLPNIVWSKPGEYFTVPILLNKRLPLLMDTENTASKEECEKICQTNPRCNAFAISEFEANCILYDNDRSNLPVKFNNYILYVLRLMEKDGYYVHKTDYYKLFTQRMTAHRAAEFCKQKEQGMLATVKVN
ncbi:hypothetical protein Pcinc_015816 [Petrolisthes cinctipes]|uniref:Apple domain-containing protein n=1 Tax=Petrolisthes cinctipes TaxID=88211 RepID=A0AAE1FU45_PETCI|nr:hypothetical protein Pcinc_015816 [Petrolisthes cinctipes]